MLPLGRSEDALVVGVMVGAKAAPKLNKPRPKAKNTVAVATATLPSSALRPPSLERTDAASRPEAKASVEAAASEAKVEKQRPQVPDEEGMARLARAARRDYEARGIKQWDLFMTLRADPVLGAELTAQCALLDFLMAGDVHGAIDEEEDEGGGVDLGVSDDDASDSESDDDDGDGVQMLELGEVDVWAEAPLEGLSGLQKKRARATRKQARHRARHRATPHALAAAAAAGAQRETVFGGSTKGDSGVPDDVAVSAFVCVAKLKLCRLAVAAHAVATREDTAAGEVFSALDPHHTAFVTAHDLLRYLQERASIYTVTSEDLALILGDAAVMADGDPSDERDPWSLFSSQSPPLLADHNSSSRHVLPRLPSKRLGLAALGSLGSTQPTSALGPSRESSRPAGHPRGGGGGDDECSGHEGRYLDRRALREVFSDPAHHRLASLLHRFTTAQVNPCTSRLATPVDCAIAQPTCTHTSRPP
jgi:hypothetical protein